MGASARRLSLSLKLTKLGPMLLYQVLERAEGEQYPELARHPGRTEGGRERDAGVYDDMGHDVAA